MNEHVRNGVEKEREKLKDQMEKLPLKEEELKVCIILF